MSIMINGSSSLGNYAKEFYASNSPLIPVFTGLDIMNEGRNPKNMNALGLILPFIEEKPGNSGTLVSTETYDVRFVEDGVYVDAESFQSKYAQWILFSKSYKVKVGDYSNEQILYFEKNRMSISEDLARKTKAITDKYTEEFLVYQPWECIIRPAKASGGKYNDNYGLLKDVKIDDFMLKPSAFGQNLRNHYRGIAGEKIEFEDVQFCVEYLADYYDVAESDIVAMASSSTLGKLKTVFYVGNGNSETFERNGMPSTDIAGIKFQACDVLPKDFILFIVASAKLITKLVNTEPQYRGVTLLKEEGLFTDFSNIAELKNSVIKIEDVGYHLTGRRFALILSTSAYGGTGAANADRVMHSTELAKLEAHANYLRGRWSMGY